MNLDPGCLLLVDDDERVHQLLSPYLERNGLTVTAVRNGTQALEWLEKDSPDLILLDVLMPGLSGLEILKQVRQKRPATELPVIMATAKDEGQDVVRALKLGANDYVTKPFDYAVVLARVQTQLLLKRRNEDLARANRRMKQDLESAGKVQLALLPQERPAIPGATFAWKYKPCTELGGDLLGIVPLNDTQVGLYVLDVSGHGVAAALLAVMVNQALTRLLAPKERGPRGGTSSTSPTTPAAVADHLNRAFPFNTVTEQFFTLLFGILDLAGRQLRFVAAGHPGPICLARDAAGRTHEVPGYPIGLGVGEYQEACLTLGPGDRLYLYSDGLTDALNPEGRRFGIPRTLQVLEQSKSLQLPASLTALLQSVEQWCSPLAPQDDISVLAVEIMGP